MGPPKTLVAWLSALALCLCCLPTPARSAEFGFSVGQDLSTFNVAGAESLSNLNTRLGVRLNRFQPVLSFDFARVSATTEFDSPDFETRKFTLTLVTLGGGLKYLFNDAEKGQVVPFVVGEAFTAIPIIRDASDDLGPAAGIDRVTSIGYLVGGGAQYQVTDGFSIGAEMGSNGFFASVDRQAKKTSLNIVQFYTAAHLAFYF